MARPLLLGSSLPLAALVLAAPARAQHQFEPLRIERYLPDVRSDGHAPGIALDVEADGDLDVVGADDWLWINDGRGVFTQEGETRMPPGSGYLGAMSLAAGDMDGDGDVDVVVGREDGERLLLNAGDGSFALGVGNLPPGAWHTHAVAVADFDGDGDLDILFGNGIAYFAEQNRLFLNEGHGLFFDATAKKLPAITDLTQTLAVGDVDGDGDLDFVTGNTNDYSGSGQNRLDLNTGNAVFADATAQHLPTASRKTSDLELADLDGDGDLDLFESVTYGSSRYYENDGSGTFTDLTAERLPTGSNDTRSLAVGDFDGDGDLDVLADGNPVGRLFVNEGAASFTERALPSNSLAEGISAGDFDGDGDLDALFGGGAGLVDRLYLNGGQGGFVDASAQRTPFFTFYQSRAFAVGDIDGDRDADIVTGAHIVLRTAAAASSRTSARSPTGTPSRRWGWATSTRTATRTSSSARPRTSGRRTSSCATRATGRSPRTRGRCPPTST